MSPPIQALPSNQEGRILLAIQAIKESQFQSIRTTADTYDIPRITLRRRLKGIALRRDSTSNTQRLTPLEEVTIVRYILDLDSRGFPPRPQAVQEMVDLLLAERDASPVG